MATIRSGYGGGRRGISQAGTWAPATPPPTSRRQTSLAATPSSWWPARTTASFSSGTGGRPTLSRSWSAMIPSSTVCKVRTGGGRGQIKFFLSQQESFVMLDFFFITHSLVEPLPVDPSQEGSSGSSSSPVVQICLL